MCLEKGLTRDIPQAMAHPSPSVPHEKIVQRGTPRDIKRAVVPSRRGLGHEREILQDRKRVRQVHDEDDRGRLSCEWGLTPGLRGTAAAWFVKTDENKKSEGSSARRTRRLKVNPNGILPGCHQL